MAVNSVTLLDPVQGLVDYVLDIKPYHTKIVEVLLEYVYNEIVDVRISDDILTQIDLAYPGMGAELNIICDGYSTRPYGDFGLTSIISPNQGVSFETYPAINVATNSFIVPGDRTGDLRAGTSIFLLSILEDYSGALDIIGVSTVTPSFTVAGDQTATYTAGYQFYVVGSVGNNGQYTVVSSAFTTETEIIVTGSISSSVVSGQLGILKTAEPNTGTFTIVSSSFSAGSIDQWPDLSDAASYVLGDDPHTVVIVAEALSAIPPLGPLVLYNAAVSIKPLIIEAILSYSNRELMYDAGIPEYIQTPDEGINQNPVVAVIDGAPGLGSFTVSGNLSVSNVFIGQTLTVMLSSGNNGQYVITSIAYNDILDQTTFGVADLVASSIVDGVLSVDISSNVFIVDGDVRTRFTQGYQFNVVGGHYTNPFTTLSSDFVDGKTRIRVISDILIRGNGSDILTIFTGFEIGGDFTSTYVVGKKFNVSSSSHNDGFYEVIAPGSTYDGVTGRTTIPVAESLDLTPDGEIYPYTASAIVNDVHGFGENSPLTDCIPETVVHVTILERLVLSSFGDGILNLSDDLIVYNLENSDTWGYDLPITWILSDTAPIILEQPTAPLAPNTDDLWFNTTLNYLSQFDGIVWQKRLTVWWVETITTTEVEYVALYYRTRSGVIDSGWLLDTDKVPGFNTIDPAVGAVEILFVDSYQVQDQGGTAQDTFTLVTGSVPSTDPTLIRVSLNGVPAQITLNSSTEFTILNPIPKIDDYVVAKVFDRTATEVNAHVIPYSPTPHLAVHDFITTDVPNNTFIVGGGNFLNRFSAEIDFDGTRSGLNVTPLVGTWRTGKVSTISVDSGLNTITISGDYTSLYTVGRIIRIEFQGSHEDFEVVSSITSGPNTVITLAQPYNNIWGSVHLLAYDRTTFSTYIIPTTLVDVDVEQITYTWYGPARFDIGMIQQDAISNSIIDHIGISNQALSYPDRYQILDTNEVENYYEIMFVDPTEGFAVDLTDKFPVRSIFDVAGSYSDNNPNSSETNDAKYVVVLSYFDDANLRYVALGGETKVLFNNLYGSYDLYRNGVPIVEGVDYAITAPNEMCFNDPTDCAGIGTALLPGDIILQIPSGVPLTWSTGSGRTFIQVDTDYDNIPPYNSFNVVSVSNNGDSPNIMRISGDHTNLFNSFADPVFRLDQPLINVDPLFNIMTITEIVWDGGLMETVLTVEENFIDEVFTGTLGIVDVSYRPEVFFDELNTTLPWVHGDIVQDALRIDQTETTLTSTTIQDNLIFGWGTVVNWDIVDTDNTANFVTIDLDGNPGTPDVRLYQGVIMLDGDQTSVIELNDRSKIRGSDQNDGDYEVAAMIYNVGTLQTDLTLRTQPRTYRITTLADIAGSLNSKYFYISSTSNYYVWLDVDNTGTDPAIAGRTGIEVHVPINATADVIATNMVAAIDQLSEFSSSTDGVDEVTITSLSSLDPLEYAIDIDSGFVVDNYILAVTPISQYGIFELTNVDVTDWFQYLIKSLDPGTQEIMVNGNAVPDLMIGQQIRVLGTPTNDSVYTLDVAPTFDAGTFATTFGVTEPLIYGVNEIIEIQDVNTLKVLGESWRFIMQADPIEIVNSTGNDGSYTVNGISQDGIYSILDISPALPDSTPDGDMEFIERGGWIESLRFQGIHLTHRDELGVSITEESNAIILTDGGSLVGAWDYPFFDVGSFDESLGTVIHLYSNVFNP